MSILHLIQKFGSYLDELNQNGNNHYNTSEDDASIFTQSSGVNNSDSDPSLIATDVNDYLKMEILYKRLAANKKRNGNKEAATPSDVYAATLAKSTPAKRSSNTNVTKKDNTSKKSNPVVNFIVNFLKLDEIANIIDKDGNRIIDKEEASAFFDKIKDYDKNGNDISVGDLFGAYNSITNGKFGEVNGNQSTNKPNNKTTQSSRAADKPAPTAQPTAATNQQAAATPSASGNSRNYNANAGNKLVNNARNNLRNTNGYCYGGVKDILQATYGGQRLPGLSAYEAAQYLSGEVKGYEYISNHFTEVKNADLNHLPAGAIVVWSQYNDPNGQHGHICIVDGQGNEYSDHKSNFVTNYYLQRGATYRVFIPNS